MANRCENLICIKSNNREELEEIRKGLFDFDKIIPIPEDFYPNIPKDIKNPDGDAKIDFGIHFSLRDYMIYKLLNSDVDSDITVKEWLGTDDYLGDIQSQKSILDKGVMDMQLATTLGYRNTKGAFKIDPNAKVVETREEVLKIRDWIESEYCDFTEVEKSIELIKKYGYSNLGSWLFDHWGVKCNPYHDSIDLVIEETVDEEYKYSLSGYLETPWSPPEGIYHRLLLEHCSDCEISIHYLELGAFFAGYIISKPNGDNPSVDYDEQYFEDELGVYTIAVEHFGYNPDEIECLDEEKLKQLKDYILE